MAITIDGTNGITFPDSITQGQGLTSPGSAPVYACRAWVNFGGTGTVAIRSSANVTSITDNGVGDYTVNMTTAMPNTTFIVSGTQRRGVSNSRGTCLELEPSTGLTASTARVRTITVDTSPAPVDCVDVMIAVHC